MTPLSPEASATPATAARDTAAPELRVVEFQNEWIVRGRYPFRYERWDTPRLAELRERYRLDDVIATGQDEWEQLLLLREWVHGRWRHGWSQAPLDNALTILAKAEQGADFCCMHYAATLVQCALALGFQARRVEIGKSDTAWIAPDEENVGHSVCEVWSQDWHKWVVLDANLNAHYAHRGVPLGALEIHRLWQAGAWREAQLVAGEAPLRVTTNPDAGFGTRFGEQWIADIFADFARYRATDYYSVLFWPMRNDHLSSTEEAPALRWFDHGEPPQLTHWNVPIGADWWTCEEPDAYWTLNQAWIAPRLVGDDLTRPTVRVTIEHSMPNLERLLVKIGEEGRWERYTESFSWPLQPGKNVIEAKPVSAFGRVGYTSRVVLRHMAPRA